MRKRHRIPPKHPVLSKISTVITILVITAVVVCLCSILTTKYIYHQPASLFGFRIVKILTDSMDPYIKANSYIAVKRVNGNDVKVGDYVLFLPEYGDLAGKGVTITHECIQEAHYDDSLNRWVITTQGKKEGAPIDPPVPVENVQSVYIGALPASGLLDFVSSKWGIVVLVALPCLAGVILQVVSMVRAVKNPPDEEKVKEEVAKLEEERKAKLQKDAVEQFMAEQSVLAFIAQQKGITPSAPPATGAQLPKDLPGGSADAPKAASAAPNAAPQQAPNADFQNVLAFIAQQKAAAAQKAAQNSESNAPASGQEVSDGDTKGQE